MYCVSPHPHPQDGKFFPVKSIAMQLFVLENRIIIGDIRKRTLLSSADCMMNRKILFHWLYKKLYTYNAFIPEEDDYDDDNDNQPEELATILKHQRHATRLYIFLLASK